MKFRYVAVLTIIMLCICTTIGLRAKRKYIDFNKQKRPLDQFVIGLLPEELVDVELKMMKQKVPLEKSNYILAVVCEGSSIFRYDNLSQPVKVKKVFQGDGVNAGDEIEISRNGSCLYLNEYTIPGGPRMSVNLNFVNEMEIGKTYLVFLKEKIKGTDIYVDSSDYFMAPCFCYDNISSTPISSLSKEGDFAKYAEVSQNEFFCTSQSAIQKLLEYKEMLLKKYAIG